MNVDMLLGVIKQHGDSQGNLAEALGVSRPTVNAKIHGRKASFTQPEIAIIKKRYNLSSEDVDCIFFATNVSNKDTRRCF